MGLRGRTASFSSAFPVKTDAFPPGQPGRGKARNRLELTVEYINNRYSIAGAWREGNISGAWTKLDEDIHGTWIAARRTLKPAIEETGLKRVPLYEWHREEDRARRYSTDAQWKEPGWRRTDRPLGLVWTP